MHKSGKVASVSLHIRTGAQSRYMKPEWLESRPQVNEHIRIRDDIDESRCIVLRLFEKQNALCHRASFFATNKSVSFSRSFGLLVIAVCLLVSIPFRPTVNQCCSYALRLARSASSTKLCAQKPGTLNPSTIQHAGHRQLYTVCGWVR